MTATLLGIERLTNFVSIYIYVHVYVGAHMCRAARGQTKVVPQKHYNFFFRKNGVLILGTHWLGKASLPMNSRDLLSLTPQFWGT